MIHDPLGEKSQALTASSSSLRVRLVDPAEPGATVSARRPCGLRRLQGRGARRLVGRLLEENRGMSAQYVAFEPDEAVPVEHIGLTLSGLLCGMLSPFSDVPTILRVSPTVEGYPISSTPRSTQRDRTDRDAARSARRRADPSHNDSDECHRGRRAGAPTHREVGLGHWWAARTGRRSGG